MMRAERRDPPGSGAVEAVSEWRAVEIEEAVSKLAEAMDTKYPDLRAPHDRNEETLERIYIGRRYRNDTGDE